MRTLYNNPHLGSLSLFEAIIRNAESLFRLDRYIKVLILVFTFITFFALESQATHGRYGNISWRSVPNDPGLVEFKVSLVYRKTFFYNINTNIIGQTLNVSTFGHGDGTTRNIPLVITSESRTEDWFFGEATFTKRYANPSGNYTAFFQFCCRISSLQNNANGTFRMETSVNLGSGNSSPISTLQPIISLPQGLSNATFLVPAFDPNGNNLTFDLTPPLQMGSGSSNPGGFTIDPQSGLATFNTNRALGLYSVSVTIDDNNGATVPVDFLIRIIPASSNNPPVFIYPPTPANGAELEVNVGEQISFNVRGNDPDVDNTVTMQATGVPVTATFTPTLPITGGIGAAVETTFSWTPSGPGSALISFSITDNNGAQATTSVTVVVNEQVCDVSLIGSSTDVTCVGGSDGTITLTPTGGTEPLEYSIDNGATYQSSNEFTSVSEGSYTAIVKDANDCTEETNVVVGQHNDLPVINSLTGAPTEQVNLSSATVNFSADVTDDNLTLAEWNWGNGETSEEVDPGNIIDGSHTYQVAGVYTVTLTITDVCGETATETYEFVVICDISLSGVSTDVTCVGGNDGTITLTPTGGTAPFQYSIDNGATFHLSNEFTGVSEGSYTAIVKDANECTEETTVAVGQHNDLPVINSLNGAPTEPVNISSATVAFSADVTDDNLTLAEWNWGDGETSVEIDPGNTIDGSHTYQEAGVYPVTLTITDVCGETATELHEFVVVYDPSGGFVTGGGWFHSPAGAYVDNLLAEGKANFGFVSKYKKGAKVPDGQTQFQFHAEKFSFHSTVYEWLVVAGHRAQYKGEGRVNGTNGYGFMLTVVDGDRKPSKETDKFRIKIWELSSGQIVYDNQMNANDGAEASTAIGGGSIVIHDGGKDNSSNLINNRINTDGISIEGDVMESVISEIRAYPNPLSSTGLWIEIPSSEFQQVVQTQIYDRNGKTMISTDFEVEANRGSKYLWKFDHQNWTNGIYVLMVSTPTGVKKIKLIK